MSLVRRDFLRLSAMAGAAAALGACDGTADDTAAGAGSNDGVRPLRVLVLGGTGFIGVHQVEYARSRGHAVTMFNRGLTNPQLFPDVPRLVGDRDGDLAALASGEWDVVIDNSATVPRLVKDTCDLLSDRVGRYVYTSSTGVYYPYLSAGLDENAPLQQLEDPTVEEVNGLTFGGLKALCEQQVRDSFGDRALVVRPVLIGGPWDYTDRSIYWPTRMARGGNVLAPGDGSDSWQLIDARDLSGWMIRMAEAGESGTYNAVGPEQDTTFAQALDEIRAAVAPDGTELHWAETDFLLEHQVRPWSEMCGWIPPRDDYVGMTAIDGRAAWAKGLTCRTTGESARDVLAWHAQPRRREGPAATPFERQAEPVAGLAADKEARVLEAWGARA